MSERAYLVLEDGSVFEGTLIGARRSAFGEVVFNTSMTGYQEILTDPSYAGQMVVLTYPLIGNYGINELDFESREIQAAALIVREASSTPSHWASTKTVDEFLRERGVPGIAGVDTRAITRRLREAGVMMGYLAVDEPVEEALERLRSLPRYDLIDFVRMVTVEAPYTWPTGREGRDAQEQPDGPLVVVLDWGVKHNIMRILTRLGCRAQVVPATTSSETVLGMGPQGVVLSPGPGNPALLDYAIETARHLIGRVPIMGICLGHQIIAHALGAATYKLKFGHRGANHPVRDLTTGRVYITAQNHGFAVDAESLPPTVEVTHVHLNDGTVEGMRGLDFPLLTIQYHSEASPGPWDNMYLFEQFVRIVREQA